MRGALFALALCSFIASIKTSFAEKPDAKKKREYYKKEIKVDLDQDAPLIKKQVSIESKGASAVDKKASAVKKRVPVADEQTTAFEEKPVRDLSSSKKKKKRRAKKYRAKASKDFRESEGELEDTPIPSLEDSLGDTKSLKAQLLQELEEEHQVGSKGQGFHSYFEEKSPKEEQKRFDFQDIELQVIGRHSEKISGKKFKRDISSNENSTGKKASKRK